MTRIAPLHHSDLDAAKRVISTVILEYYFDGHYDGAERAQLSS